MLLYPLFPKNNAQKEADFLFFENRLYFARAKAENIAFFRQFH